MTARRPSGNRLLRLVMHLDQAGSAAFIVVALAAAPVFVVFGSMRLVLWILGLALMAYAVGLALLGICMAVGLTRMARRGEQLTPEAWRALLKYPASAEPPVARPVATARPRPGSPAGRG